MHPLLQFQAEDGIRDAVVSRGLGDVYKRQKKRLSRANYEISVSNEFDFALTNHNVDETAKKIIKLIKT